MNQTEELEVSKINKRLQKIEKIDLNERLGYIEIQLKNFVLSITEMKNLFRDGIKISINQDSLNVAKDLNLMLKQSIGAIQDELAKMQKLRKEIENERKNLQDKIKKEEQNEGVTGAIQYMSKRINELTQLVYQIKEEGIKKQIHLDLTMEGYEMIKRKPPKINPEPEDEEINAENAINALLDTLLTREKTILIHRYGLLGEKAKTFIAIGTILRVSGQRIREIKEKALKKCRHATRRNLVENITHKELRFDILGE